MKIYEILFFYILKENKRREEKMYFDLIDSSMLNQKVCVWVSVYRWMLYIILYIYQKILKYIILG